MVQALDELHQIDQEAALEHRGVDGPSGPWAGRNDEGGGRVRDKDGEAHWVPELPSGGDKEAPDLIAR